MKKWMIFLLFLFLSSASASAQTNGLSLGPGFGLFNTNQNFGQVQENQSYYFLQFSYFQEWPLFRKGYFVLEPFAAYLHRPEAGWEVGLNLLFRYYVKTSEKTKLFGNLGIGLAYTSVHFAIQGTHYLFAPQIGIGFSWGDFFIENRYRHYSNADLAEPNGAVNANMILLGVYF